ncbi:MAG: GNAT family N-acetyltransferase [Actinomycetota bacterium]
MGEERFSKSDMSYHPLTPERWDDFEELFGEHGAYGGCWCMYWRTTRAQFNRDAGEGNKRAMKAIVDAGTAPGILAYHRGRAVGWCSVAPREDFASLERSPKLKRVDGQPVWSIVCFYVPKEHRRRGLMELLLEAAVAYARENGAAIVEGYPTEPMERLKGAEGYMGLRPSFVKAGFREVARPCEWQSIARLYT